MRIFITGANGFVGVNLVEHLLEQGHNVTACGLGPMPDAALAAFAGLSGALEPVALDVRDRAAVRAATARARPEAVILGAAITPAAASDADTMVDLVAVNVLGAVQTLEAAFEAGAQRAVFLSSASVYGAAVDAGTPLDEATNFPAPTTGYGACKLAAERLALRFGECRGVPVRAVRIGTVFGRWERETGLRQTMSPIHQVMRQALAGERVALPRPCKRDFIYAPDVARAVATVLFAENAAHDLYNVGLGAEWTVEDWCAALAQRRDFSWSMAGEGLAPTVNLFGPADRPMMRIDRLRDDLGFAPAFPMAAALDDYLAWLDRHGAM